MLKGEMKLESLKTPASKRKTELAPLLKLVFEVGPLGVFFVSNAKFGIFYATAAFMTATVLSLTLSRIFLKRIPILALVTGVFVMFFGFLTIYLQDDTFIKIKPTIINILFASILAAGLYFRRPVLKLALGEVMDLKEEGWKILTARWIGFFILLAILNEIVWRNYSTNTWVSFKSFGIMPLTLLFMMSQLSLIMKYQVEAAESSDSETQSL